MKKNIILVKAVGLTLVFSLMLGCSSAAYELGYSMGYRNRMKAMIEAIYGKKIPVTRDPRLPWLEKSPLSSIPPLKIFLSKFLDARKGNDGKIAAFQEEVDVLITTAVKNEFERNKHIVIEDPAEKISCDFIMTGKIEDFSSLPYELIADQKIKELNNKNNWATKVVFEINIEGTSDSTWRETRTYSKVVPTRWVNTSNGWDAVPSFENVGKSLDETLVKAIRDVSNDEALIKALQARKK